MKSIFELHDQEKPLILRFLDVAGNDEYEEIIISETSILKAENLNLYRAVMDYFKQFGFYLEYGTVSSYIDDINYYECDVEELNDEILEEISNVFSLNLASDLFIKNIRLLKNSVIEPVLRLYIPNNGVLVYE